MTWLKLVYITAKAHLEHKQIFLTDFDDVVYKVKQWAVTDMTRLHNVNDSGNHIMILAHSKADMRQFTKFHKLIFAIEWVELPASGLHLIQSNVLLTVCTFPAFLPILKSLLVGTFCNVPHYSHHIILNLFNVIQSVIFSCLLKLWKQEVTWSQARGV